MKKFLTMGAAALLMGASFTSCSKDKDLYDPVAQAQNFLKNYEAAFVEVFGQPSADQTWGFGTPAQARVTRSMSTPECPGIDAPYDEAWVAAYNQKAQEPNSTNVDHNYNNTTYATNNGEGGPNYIDWNDPAQVKDRKYFFGDDGNTDTWEQRVAWALENHPSWVTYNIDSNWVTEFKITGTYDGTIGVLASEGLTDGGEATHAERTVVVSGTWNINNDQRVGSLGKIIIANGGTVNVASGKKLNMVNEARLVVLEGGKLTGAGTVEVNNGNGEGLENYNAGTIDVATFNNNFGKFYNYGKFLVNEYQAGAVESNIYNHSLVAIDHTSSVANARVFNACQFYVKNDARLRNYEGVMGSALIVGGQFMPFGSADGTSIPSYVSLAAGALVKCGSLYNGSSWVGPTEGGYAALEIVNQIDYLNWVQDSPQTAGYFANNLYVKCGTWENDPAGQGKHQDVDDGSEWGHINYTESRAEYKFWTVAANCTGNGNVTKVFDGTNELLPADSDFELSVKGCTPGFKGNIEPTPTPEYLDTPDYRIIAEDLNVGDARSDFDFNDIVFDVYYNQKNATKAKIKVQAAGGTMPLEIRTAGLTAEVHNLFGVATTDMVNTGAGPDVADANKPFFEVTIDKSVADDNIKLYVNNGTAEGPAWNELTAQRGRVASKIKVAHTYQYCSEREDIEVKYPLFKQWVKDPSVEWY